MKPVDSWWIISALAINTPRSWALPVQSDQLLLLLSEPLPSSWTQSALLPQNGKSLFIEQLGRTRPDQASNAASHVRGPETRRAYTLAKRSKDDDGDGEEDEDEKDALPPSRVPAYDARQGTTYQHGWRPNWANLPSKPSQPEKIDEPTEPDVDGDSPEAESTTKKPRRGRPPGSKTTRKPKSTVEERKQGQPKTEQPNTSTKPRKSQAKTPEQRKAHNAYQRKSYALRKERFDTGQETKQDITAVNKQRTRVRKKAQEKKAEKEAAGPKPKPPEQIQKEDAQRLARNTARREENAAKREYLQSSDATEAERQAAEQKRLNYNAKSRETWAETQVEKQSRPETPGEVKRRLDQNEQRRERSAKKKSPKVYPDENMPDDLDPAERKRLLRNADKRKQYHAKKNNAPSSNPEGSSPSGDSAPLLGSAGDDQQEEGKGREGDVPAGEISPMMMAGGSEEQQGKEEEEKSMNERVKAFTDDLFASVQTSVTGYLGGRKPAVVGGGGGGGGSRRIRLPP